MGRTVTRLKGKGHGYDDLDGLCRALGLEPSGEYHLELLLDSTPVTVSLDINSGSVVGLIVLVGFAGGPSKFDRPFLDFTKESRSDVEGKQRGINREVQLGDSSFDPAVYVDSDAPDAEVKRFLSTEGTRLAVRQLLDGGAATLRVTPKGLSAQWKVPGAPPSGQAGVTAIERMLTVTRGGPPRGQGGPRRGAWLVPVLAATSVALPFVTYLAGTRWWPAGWLPVLAGAGAGLALIVGLRSLLLAWVTGDSGSYRRYFTLLTLSGCTAVFLGPLVVLALNAWGDPSPATPLEGDVIGVLPPTEDDDAFDVDVRWVDGSTERLRTRRAVEAGQRVHRRVHRGRLGFAWREPDTFGR